MGHNTIGEEPVLDFFAANARWYADALMPLGLGLTQVKIPLDNVIIDHWIVRQPGIESLLEVAFRKASF